ncbi:cytochrome c oxidase subunit II [Ammoniphilus sp. CFH 90114]|uniref:cytochrome c oxidase subunit II n=1 Tax=Ammoniphilus sp. CFH 90114 TaxID=2493665 RepID=UPI00100EB5F5|nr:cytochrome c oxidase subunit II [Ammoniphilus sp. CFH 90114]RXT08916.1 cytochrome B5 [Ammoniphilus sp. CFH 90114]
MHIHKYEKLWLILGTGTLIVFLATVGVSAYVQGNHPPSSLETIHPDMIDVTPPFDNPGVVQIGENEYEVNMVSLAYAYIPYEISVPKGATVHFNVVTKDVLHGFEIAGTSANFMVVPGHISKHTAVFNQPGEYLILCNEYCGLGHHVMNAKLEVTE